MPVHLSVLCFLSGVTCLSCRHNGSPVCLADTMVHLSVLPTQLPAIDPPVLPFCRHQVAERTITDDLEYLIEKAVDPATADYAVITGVQIHNWGKELSDNGDASIEFVAPAKAYTVVNGLKTYIDLPQVRSSAI